MEEKYLLDGKTYDKSQIEYYAKKSKVSFDEYLNLAGVKKVKSKEPVVTQKKATKTAQYIIDGKTYDKSQVEYYAKKSNVSFDEYIDLAGVKKKAPTSGTGQPSQEASSTRTDRSKSLSATERPQDQKVSDGSGGKFRLPTEDDYIKMQEQGVVPVESKESYIARAKAAKKPTYSLKQNEAELTKEESEKLKSQKISYDARVKQDSELPEPKKISISEAIDQFNPFEDIVRTLSGKDRKSYSERIEGAEPKKTEKSPLELLKDLTSRAVSRRKEDAELKLKYYESTPFNDNKSFSNRVRKPAEYDVETQSYIEQEPYDGFIEKHYNTDDLKSLGIDLDDFDGFLERRGLKQLIKTRDERGDFSFSAGVGAKEITPEEMSRRNSEEIDNKATSRQALIKRALDQYIKEKELKNNDYKTSKKLVEQGIYDPVYEEVVDRASLGKYVENNLPNLNNRIQEKKRIDKQDYEDIVAKNGSIADEALYMAKNIKRNASEGFGDRIVDMIASTADYIGAGSSAEAWRDYKYLDELARPSKKLAGIESNLKKVVYNNKTYGVDLKGNIYDVDAEVLVNEFIDPVQATKITQKAKDSKEYTSIVGFQGLAGDFSRTMADMGVQVGVQALVGALTAGTLNELLLARNITALRNAGVSALDLQKATSVANKLKDASIIDSAVLAEAGITYNEYVAAQNVLSELKSLAATKTSNLANFYADFSKTTKLPVTKDVGDAMIAQGAMGYSSGYEQTLKSAREAGLSEDKARELAETSAKMTAALYAVTTPIQPNVKIKEALFGDGLRTSINNAINSYKKGGLNSFKNSLVSGLKVLHEEGKKELIQENVQQLGEIYGVNAYINKKAGTKLAQDEYSFNDFLNTSFLSYAAGGLLPGLSAGLQSTAKQNVLNLYNIGENIDKVTPILDEFVEAGKATQEQVDKLKREALSVHRNSTKIPPEVPYEKRTEVSVLLEDISDLEEKKKTVDVSFHDDINKQIETKRKEIQKVVGRPEEVVVEEVVEKPVEQKPEAKNSLSLFQEISEMTNKSQMQEFSQQNPDVAFIHNNIEGIIKGIDGAKVVEC